jgi:Zn-dependent protease with chaperone function
MKLVATMKLGFRRRQLLYTSVILFSAAYVLSPPSLVLRLMLLAAIAVSSDITFSLFAAGLILPPVQLYLSRKSHDVAEIAEIREVATKAGVVLPARAFSLTDADITAVTNVYTRKMAFNRGLLSELTPDERRFVGGHEITHIKDGSHSLALLWVCGIGSTLAVAVPLTIMGLPSSLVPLPAFAAMIIAIYFTQRRAELRADLGGAKFVSFDVAKSAMIKVYGARGMDWTSDTHPSGNNRVENLRKYFSRQ